MPTERNGLAAALGGDRRLYAVGGANGIEPGPLVILDTAEALTTSVPPLTSKGQCTNGGWRNHTDDQGRPFKNQEQCVNFVVHASNVT
jgi:hypothetical protein